MTTIVFVHSAGAQGPGEGSSRLLEGLKHALPPELTLVAPPMPEPEAPSAAGWKGAVRDAISAVTGDMVLVGHSLGGSTILQVLAEGNAPKNLRGVVVLAAPFWSAADWNVAEYALPAEAGEMLKGLRLIVLQGDKDDQIPNDHAERYGKLVPAAEIRMLPGIDHEAADAAPSVLEAVQSLLAP